MRRLATRTISTGDLCFALALDRLHPSAELDPGSIGRDASAFITALEGQRDARFIVQTLSRPDVVAPERGRLEVHLLVAMSAETPPERIDELADDLLDLLTAPPVRWSFRPVEDPEALAAAIEPFVPSHLAEIARREEPCMPTAWETEVGFVGDPTLTIPRRGLWSLWTFGPPSADLRRLGSVLLAQEAPVCIRVSLTPTDLSAAERAGIEEVARLTSDGLPPEGLTRASLTTIESLLYLRPVFDARCTVASPEPLSRSLLSAIGHSISEPAQHGASPVILQGGFAVLRADHDVDRSLLSDAHLGLSGGEPVPGLGPPGLDRLRRLFGPWEAAHLFRFPVSDGDGFPGLSTLRLPDLDTPLADLAVTGNVIGRLAADQRQEVHLEEGERFRHLYVSGQTGTGKSTLVLQLALQDIEAGSGVAVIDPHGDLVQEILGRIPDDRLDDVVLVDPADSVAVVGVNLLEAETPAQRDHIVSELAAMFYALFDPQRQGIVGPRYETWLRQAALLLLANPDQPSSLLDIPTVFTNRRVQAGLLENISDPILEEFWHGEMGQTSDFHKSEVLGWFRSKFEVFRTSQLVRNVLGQARSTISFSRILDEQKILLVNLSKGLLGQYNSALIGHVVFARIWAAALERAALPTEKRHDFFLYVDEFQNMTTDSLPAVLSEARKFRVGLTLANQFFTQVPDQTRDAIMGNVSSRVTFRLGPKDASPFATWLGPHVDAHDLTRLPNHVAVAALSTGGVPVDPFVLRTNAPSGDWSPDRATEARQRSRELWATPVEELDAAFFSRWSATETVPTLSGRQRVPGRDPAQPGGDSRETGVTAGTTGFNELQQVLADRSDDTREEKADRLPSNWLDRWVVAWILNHFLEGTVDLRVTDTTTVAREEYEALLSDRLGFSKARSDEVFEGAPLAGLGLPHGLALRYELERLGAVTELTPDLDPDDPVTPPARVGDDDPLEVLALSDRPRNCLIRAGITTIAELTTCTAADLREIRNFGARSLEETRETLSSIGLVLRDDPPPPSELTLRALRHCGVRRLTDREMSPLLSAAREELELRAGARVLDQLGPEGVDEFERAQAESREAAKAVLDRLVPDHRRYVDRAIEELLDEVRAARVPLQRATSAIRAATEPDADEVVDPF